MLAAILLSLIVGQAPLKNPGWERSESVGNPRALEVWSPGVYSVAAEGGIGLYFGDQIVGSVPTEPNEAVGVGTFLSPPPSNCFVAVRSNGVIDSRGPCRPPDSIIPSDPVDVAEDVKRVKHTASGRAYAAVTLSDARYLLLTADAGVLGGTPWTPLLKEYGLPTEVLGVVETDGGVPHALFGIAGDPNTQLIWVTGDRERARLTTPSTQPPLTADLIAGAGPNPVALVGNADGLFRAQLAPAGTSFQRVTVAPPVDFNILSVDVNTGKGSVHGEGFGLAVGTDSEDKLVILGAVPADSAANAGTSWRPHRGLQGIPVSPEAGERMEVACVDSTYCVITMVAPAGNIVMHTNAYAPTIDVGTPSLVLNEGQDGGVTASATDLDGDAVRMSLDASTALGVLDSVSTVARLDFAADAGPDLLDVRLVAREVCQDEEPRKLTVFASDGLGTHDAHAEISVTVLNTRGPGAPTVALSDSSTSASGAALGIMASRGAGPCEPVAYEWGAGQPEDPDQPAAPALEVDGATATFVPPDTLCWPEPVQYTYTVRGQDQGLQWSDRTSFTVRVTPWGPPLAPFGQGAERRLESGPDAGVVVAPDALHACFATANQPTMETEWRLSTPGAGVPAGLTVKDSADAGVTWDSPVVSPRLRVEAAECTSATLSLTARNRVVGSAQEGPEATVQVVARPPVENFGAAQLNLAAVPTENGQVDVTLGTSLRCPNAFSLKAALTLKDAAGDTVASDEVAVTETWSPSLPEVCAAASYTVEGQLFDESTEPRRAGARAQTSVTVPARDIKLGPLEGGELVARCGEGATGTLTQTIPPDACRAVALSWARVRGPELVDRPLSGESVTVATGNMGLEELVGQTLRLSVTANASESNSVTREHDVRITTEPFVDVRHETESPTGSEKGLVGVVVRLRNTSECRVGNLRHVERLDGLEWVPGSVKVDGQPVVEKPVEGGFAVDGVTLEARATGTLTYVARPRLLSSPRYGGEVFLNTVLVSGSVPPAPTSGCGCSGGGSGAAVFGLVALARLLRRRRHGTPGAPR